MAVTLVQSVLGGSASASVPTQTVVTTSPAGFPLATTAGNFLVCIVWATARGASASTPAPVTAPALGFTWSALNAPTYFTSSPRSLGEVVVFYRTNAPSISFGTVGTATANSGSGASTLSVEFCLFEFSGVDQTNALIDAQVTPSNKTNSSPGANLTTTQSDLILVATTADSSNGSNLFAGAGFTLGPTAVVATIGQIQYALNAPAGSISAFFSGTEPSWGAQVIAFKPAPVVLVPILQVAPLAQAFTATQGGVNPASQNIAVANGNGGTLSWTVASDQSWLTALPASGTDAGVVAATVDVTGLVAGTYTGHLTFTAAGATGSPQIVTVTLTITPAATALLVLPTTLSFGAVLGTGNPASQSATVSNTGTPGTMNFTLVTNQIWLTVVPTTGNAGVTPVALVANVNVTGLAAGVYTATATITATGAVGSPQNIITTLTITAPPPPSPVITSSKVLTQVDTWELDNGLENWGTDTGTPYAWHETTLPQQQIAVAPTPDDVGQIGLLYDALAKTLDGTGVALTVPDDWAPYIVWGVLSELLGSDGDSYDPVRAAYCERRFNEGIELARLVLGG